MIIRNIIDKDIVSEMPRVEFEGEIRVAETPQEAERAVEYLRAFPILGIDTETRPSYKKGEYYKVSLLQVSTMDVCYLIRLNKTGLTQPVVELLESPDIIKVGLSLKDDFLMLQQRGAFTPCNFVELQEQVCAFGIEEKSLQKVYALLFGEKISKRQRLSNWNSEQLTTAQKKYAATDAWACLQIYHKLEELRRTGDFTIERIEKTENHV